MWKKLWEKFKTPNKALLAVTYVVTAVCIAWAMVMLVISPGNLVLEMDKKVKTPARAFAYALGTVGALTLGAGMSFAMKVIGGGWSIAMPLGIVVGCIGIAIVSGNYFLYKKVLANRKKKYSGEILALSEEILNA